MRKHSLMKQINLYQKLSLTTITSKICSCGARIKGAPDAIVHAAFLAMGTGRRNRREIDSITSAAGGGEADPS